jgi:molecular chaperone DnaK
MAKRFIACAIDHGTTNSAIAYMDGDQPRVISPTSTEATMPSAIYYRQDGARFVGSDAYEAMGTQRRNGSGRTGYKVTLGQAEDFEFAVANRRHTGVELCGFVLGELLRLYEAARGVRPRAAVITVPAMFEPSAVAATRAAAELAGLEKVVTIQEPVAAALAYGFEGPTEGERWIVFDIGGGTLDVSLVTIRHGSPTLEENAHEGDNTLGGRLFDTHLEAHLLGQLEAAGYSIQKLRAACTGSGPEARELDHAAGQLRYWVEQVKIQLTSEDSATVGRGSRGTLLAAADDGRDIEVSITVKRSDYERLIAPDVDRAVRICEMLLEKNRLAPRDIARLILVGGPSKTPYVRAVLTERLGIALEDSIDPMLAVVQGAALFAATQEDPTQDTTPELSADGSLSIELEYEKQSPVPSQEIAGRVTGSGTVGRELFVRFERTDGEWASEQIPVGEGGAFTCTLQLLEQRDGERPVPCHSKFVAQVTDAFQNVLHRIEEPSIWHPFPRGDARSTRSIRVALADGGCEVLIPKGKALPARGRHTFKSAGPVTKGSDAVLRIPVLAGWEDVLGRESARADCHAHIGTLVIPGDGISGDIPQGADVDVRVDIDDSLQITVSAQIPLTRDRVEGEYFHEDYQADFAASRRRFAELCVTLDNIHALERRDPIPEVQALLARLDEEDFLAQLALNLDRWEDGHAESRKRGYQRLIELAATVEALASLQRPARIRALLARIVPVCPEEHREALATLQAELAAAQEANDPAALASVEAALEDLVYELFRAPLATLALDIAAVSGVRVTPEQLEAWTRARDGFEDCCARELSELTSHDAERLRALHTELEARFPDLPDRRRDWLERNPGQDLTPSGLRSGVRRG